MSWQIVRNGVDAVESWLAGVSYWIQVPVLLVVLLPAVWVLAGLVDRLVEKLLWPHTRREMRLAAGHAIAGHETRTPDVRAIGTPDPDSEHVRGTVG